MLYDTTVIVHYNMLHCAMPLCRGTSLATAQHIVMQNVSFAYIIALDFRYLCVPCM